VAGGVGVDDFERERLKAVGADLKGVTDASYGENGRSPVRLAADDLGAVYVRLPGDAWSLGAGFAVVRPKSSLGGLFGALGHADDKDRASVPWGRLVVLGIFFALAGLGLTAVEHTLPFRELGRQLEQVKSGTTNTLQVGRLTGPFRAVAEALNRALEQAAAAAAKAAAAQPSARAAKTRSQPLPRLAARDSSANLPPSVREPARSTPGDENGELPTSLMQAKIDASRGIPQRSSTSAVTPPPPSAAAPGRASPALIGPTLPSRGSEKLSAENIGKGDIGAVVTMHAAVPVGLLAESMAAEAAKAAPAQPENGVAHTVPPPTTDRPLSRRQNNAPDTTAVRTAPAAVLSLATGGGRTPDTTAIVPAPLDLLSKVAVDQPSTEELEWRATFEDYIRVRKECGEATESITFEKFSATLKKHRDALVTSSHCKRVKFAVAVKDGKASLKATPLQ
jgi:hypothetical protein